MFIPIRADATVYYRAWATFVIIAANLVLFFLYNPANHVELLVLEFGTLKPWQWITGTFTHADILHVGVNMLFLFWFGQIVEGRIGTFRFLGIYLGMAAAAGLVTQILMLGADEGGAIGASGVIYGLMVIAMVLTPTTRVSVLWWFYSASRVIEMPIRTLAATYLALNLIVAALFGFGMSSEVLHLLGALAGLGAVFVIRKYNWWYEPPEDEVAGDMRVAPVMRITTPAEENTAKPPQREDLPPLELD